MSKRKKLIIVIIVILFFFTLSYFTYNQIKKEKEFILDATIEKITEHDNKYTIILKGLVSNTKTKQGEYEIEVNNDTKILFNGKPVKVVDLKEGKKIRVVATNIILIKEPPLIPEIKKIII